MSKRKTYADFLAEANDKYSSKYRYDETTYVNTHTKMKIICPEHGEFWQTPKNHLRYECYKCGIEKRSKAHILSTEDFIKKAKEKHGNKYDYSEANYTGIRNNISIICPKHGRFYQKPMNHMAGKGCPICNFSHLETEVKLHLESNKIDFIWQYKPEWLNKMSLDFFLPSLNIAIECQGKQHFGFGGWKDDFNFQKLFDRDRKKASLCKEKGVTVAYLLPEGIIPEDELNDIYTTENIFYSISEIVETLCQQKNL